MFTKEGNFSRSFGRFTARVEGKLDQGLTEIRNVYLELDSEQRKGLRRWLRKLAGAEVPTAVPLNARTRVCFTVPYAAGKSVSVSISPRMLLRAIKAWDEGHDYVPKIAG